MMTSRNWIRTVGFLSIFAWWALASGCRDTTAQREGGEGWTFGTDSGAAEDTRGRDTWPDDRRLPDTSTEDTTHRGTATRCRDLLGESACAAEDGCNWWSNPCRDDGFGGCFPADETPSLPDCKVGVCFAFDDADDCSRVSKCDWKTRSCPERARIEACVGPNTPSLPDCPDDDACADRAPERCNPGECETYEPGCGATPDEFDEPACLPTVDCSDDAHCEADESCEMISVRPDNNGGDEACGLGLQRCVPEAWVDRSGGCRALDRGPCERTERCQMLGPTCNDRAGDDVLESFAALHPGVGPLQKRLGIGVGKSRRSEGHEGVEPGGVGFSYSVSCSTHRTPIRRSGAQRRRFPRSPLDMLPNNSEQNRFCR